MFYKKKIKVPKKECLEIKIDDFSKGLNFNKDENLLDPKYSVNNYNFNYSKGVLTEGLGFETLKCPNYQDNTLTEMMFDEDLDPLPNLNKLWLYKIYDLKHGTEYDNGWLDKLMYYGENKLVYYHRIISIVPIMFQLGVKTLPDKPAFSFNIKYNGINYSLFGCESTGVYKFDNDTDPVLMTDMPKLSSMCEDKGKLFGTTFGEKDKIYYHVGGDFVNWTTQEDENNGKIEMNDERGKINKVIPFLGYVFAIRDYGISKISHQEGKTKFDITHLSLNGNKIYDQTVKICGDKMLMLTKEGIMMFNGVTTKILNLGVNDLLYNIENDDAIACFHSGKYYLACRIDFKDGNKVLCEEVDGYKNNAIVVLDVDNLSYDIIRGIDCASMESIKLNKMDKVVMLLNNLERTKTIQFNDSGAFYSTPLKKKWVSTLTDLGYSNKIKFVREFNVLTKYPCKITIFTEKESREYNVLGSNTLNKIKVDLKGKQIGLKIESDTAKAYISNIKLKIDLLDYGFTRY